MTRDEHDPLCLAGNNLGPKCSCALIAYVQRREREQLRAKVRALPDEWDHPLEDYEVIEIVLALLDGEVTP